MSETAAYDPAQVESRWYRRWTERDLFRPEVRPEGEPYTIMIPPPNITGVLHMGHALNNTIQDVLVRYQRLRGRRVLWMPGTDHAGIATQNVVERELRSRGESRHQMGREAFLERVWAWKDKHGRRIVEQLKRLGCSCDWSRERFTLDEGLSRAVQEVFIKLHQRGLIYRGERLVNWCVGEACRTALSDEEAPNEEEEGSFWHLRYPLHDQPGRFIVVATTRPETMLGDTGVAVHPEDPRYRDLVGRTVRLPLLGRALPIVADAYADPAKGSGAVKITPAHDFNDFEVGRRCGLPLINILNPDGTLNAAAGPYAGLERFAARRRVLEDLESQGLIEKVEAIRIPVPRCQRCNTVVEPYLSKQWFVRMEPLARKAVASVREGRTRFVPERYQRTYFDWLEQYRDWCISRQLWWGHRIPAWYCGCQGCAEVAVSLAPPGPCPACGCTEWRPEEDVLDTWFSSALWPFSTLGWPEKSADLAAHYPTDVLVTARDIIYFWVARMMIAGLEFMDREPFHTVYINGTVLDAKGRRMSKSLGNGIDPIEMIDTYGCDAVRFYLMQLTTEGQDIKLDPRRFETGRHFANKLFHAARFVLGHLEGSLDAGQARAPEDLWILSQLGALERRYHEQLGAYRFSEAVQDLYGFLWGDFCDWYLEWIKPRLATRPAMKPEGGVRNPVSILSGAKAPPAVETGTLPCSRASSQAADDDAARVRRVLAVVLDRYLRLLHPFMPFITEELWDELRRRIPPPAGDADAEALMVASLPEPLDVAAGDAGAVIAQAQAAVRALRNLRATMNLKPAQRLRAGLNLAQGPAAVALVGRLLPLEAGPTDGVPEGAVNLVGDGFRIRVELAGLVDPEAERKRLGGLLEKERKNLEGLERKLADRGFIEKAPPEAVRVQEGFREATRERIGQIEDILRGLGDT